MSRKVRILAALMVVLTMIMTLAACGTTAKTDAGVEKSTESQKQETTAEKKEEPKEKKFDVTVTMLIPQSNVKEAFKKMFELVKQKTGVTIDAQAIPDDQFKQISRTKLATGDMTDISRTMGAPTQEIFIDTTASSSDDLWADLGDQPWVQRMVNKNFKSKKGGKYLLAPIESAGTPIFTYYNKDIFTKAGITKIPETWNDFLAACEAIKKSGVTPILMTDKDLWTTQIYPNHVFNPFLPGATQDKLDAIKAALDSNQKKAKDYPEIFKKGLDMFHDLYTKGYTNAKTLSTAYDDSFAIMNEGKAAMYTNGAWWISDVEKKFPGSAEKFGAFPIPSIDNPPLFCGFTCQGFAVYGKSKNLDAAKAAVNALTQPDVLGLYYQENPGFPGYTDVDGGKLASCLKDVYEKYLKSQNMVGDAIDLQVRNDNEIWKLYQDLIAGGKTSDQVVDGMDKIFQATGKAKKLSGF